MNLSLIEIKHFVIPCIYHVNTQMNTFPPCYGPYQVLLHILFWQNYGSKFLSFLCDLVNCTFEWIALVLRREQQPVFTAIVKRQYPLPLNLGNTFWPMTIWIALGLSNQYFHILSMAPLKSRRCRKYFSRNLFFCGNLAGRDPKASFDLHKTDITAAFQFYFAVMYVIKIHKRDSQTLHW